MASTSLTCGYLSFFNKNHFPSCIQQFDSKNPRTPRYNPKRNATNMEISIFHEPKLPIEVERNAHFFPKKLPTDFGPVLGSLWFLSSAPSNLSVIGHGLRFGSFAAKPTGVLSGVWWCFSGGKSLAKPRKIVPDSRSSHVLLQHNFLICFFRNSARDPWDVLYKK